MLDKTSIKILKLLKSKGSLSLKDIEQITSFSRHSITDNLETLETGKYIINLRDDEVNMLDDDGNIVRLKVAADIYKLMPHGKAYLESIFKDKFRFWFPVTLSIIALVISVIALCKP